MSESGSCKFCGMSLDALVKDQRDRIDNWDTISERNQGWLDQLFVTAHLSEHLDVLLRRISDIVPMDWVGDRVIDPTTGDRLV